MQERWAALPQGIRWLVSGIAAVVAILVGAWLLFVPGADWLAHHDVGSATGTLLQSARDAARGRLLTLGAGVFAIGALWFTARNFTLSREGQVTDRYTKAIEQLGSDKIDIRIGGIYALERIARDSAKDHPTVMAVLTAFVREHSQEHREQEKQRKQLPPRPWSREEEQKRFTRPDIQAALTVIGRRDPSRDNQPIDLTGAFLDGAKLSGANLADADLVYADLVGASLDGANLAQADLAYANLSGAVLDGANFAHANLQHAKLCFGGILGSILSAVNSLGGSGPARLDFAWADLTDADLSDARLIAANFEFAKLKGANLERANLEFATLNALYSEDANLTGAKLHSAWWTGPMIPEGWKRDARTYRLYPADTDSGSEPVN